MSDSHHSDDHLDEVTGVRTTGHEWDGIQELDNPMPRWWLWTFYATIVFALGYVVYYPAIPLFNDSTRGISGHTNRLQLKRDLEAVELSRRDKLATLISMNLEQVRTNPELSRFAAAGGASLFKVNCSQCHGSGAQGGPGYPNLNDDDWIWGGDLASIYHSIKHGIRNTDSDDARVSEMPAFGANDILNASQIATATEFVLRLSGKQYDDAQAKQGAEVFAENCATCHGDLGNGNLELGAPNLADAISLYGATRATIRNQIVQPRHGAMPAWGDRLGEASIRQLAVYVHGLGGGEAPKSED